MLCPRVGSIELPKPRSASPCPPDMLLGFAYTTDGVKGVFED